MSTGRRRYVLAGLLLAVAVLTAYLLRGVLSTVFFAITIAYILSPLRNVLVSHGVSDRVAATLSTLAAFLAGVLLMTPLVGVLYFRRREMFAFLRDLPETFSVSAGEFTYSANVSTVIENSRGTLEEVAVSLAGATPDIALKLFLFTLIVYALLLRPSAFREAVLRPVPGRYHDIVLAYNERTKSILYAIYVVQAAVGFGTFLIALVVFWVLGYDSVFALSVLSGILQFIPILGPSVVILGLAAIDLVGGDPQAAIVVTVVGLVVIGFLPDALIRPRLARLTSGIPGSLYFVGFTGGILSVGLIGLVAGPVVVALLAEAVSLLSAEVEAQRTLTPTRPDDQQPPTR
ncbi:MAG: putative PurR-regulated permease PerM [Haloarculaceae archaeon]|jgi:predicted PurR-regulated permease PerM